MPHAYEEQQPQQLQGNPSYTNQEIPPGQSGFHQSIQITMNQTKNQPSSTALPSHDYQPQPQQHYQQQQQDRENLQYNNQQYNNQQQQHNLQFNSRQEVADLSRNTHKREERDKNYPAMHVNFKQAGFEQSFLFLILSFYFLCNLIKIASPNISPVGWNTQFNYNQIQNHRKQKESYIRF